MNATATATNKLEIEPRTYQHFIDGREFAGSSTGTITRQSPGHGVTVSTYIDGTADDVDSAVAAARRAFDEGPWPHSSAAEKQVMLLKVAGLITQHADELARIECLESGKPLAQAREEMHWAAGLWNYAATLPRHLHGESHNQLGADVFGMTLREPIGVVGMITPWNFPLLIISQKLPFALAAGCTAVIKPSELTSGTTLRLAGLLMEAGLPAGVVNVVTGLGRPVGQRIAEHPEVDMVSFTGSTVVGKAIAAASQSNLKKVSLELGGKNPQIVFPDADLDTALDAIAFGCYFNMGECCNSGSRLLLHRDVPDDYIDRIVDAAASIKVGDPLDASVRYGAIINREQHDKILAYIKSAQGSARLLTGGQPLTDGVPEQGRYIQPTVFADVQPGSPLADQEVFGPVLSILRFDSLDEAVRIANSTMYGLSASVWSPDLSTALRAARGIRAGTIWMNTFLEGTPELPFGGFGHSGLGRELGSNAAEEFTETKTLYARLNTREAAWL